MQEVHGNGKPVKGSHFFTKHVGSNWHSRQQLKLEACAFEFAMDCRGAMFALRARPVAMASVRLRRFAFTSKLPNGRFRLRQLTQVRMNCHSQRTRSLHGLDRRNGHGATILISGYKRVGCLASEDLGVGAFDLEEEEGEAWLVDEVVTPFNQISVLELDDAADHELAGAYVLKLDSANLAHSVYWLNGQVWSGGCHDVFASLPPLLPEGGPVAILGLGAGTVARLLLHIWPSLHLEGWELDPEVIRVARQYFALTELESPPAQKASPNPISKTKKVRVGKKSRGRLVVHIGDALGAEATVKGGFTGIMVDIFINGTVCKELGRVSTWRALKQRLRPGGRIMVNCIPNSSHLQDGQSEISRQWDELMHLIVRAMEVVFPGEVSVRELTDGNNVMLLSGEIPEVAIWSSKVPDRLVQGVLDWKRWDASHPHWEDSQTFITLNPKP